MDDWLTLRARTHGDRPAVVAEGRVVTYAELDGAAARTARRLAALGVEEGDLVATTLPPEHAFCELLHALPRLGAVLVPLNTRLTAAERALQVEDSGARLVVDEPPHGPEADVPLREQVDEDAVQTVVYTSGTTGRGKRVELTFGNHAASAIASAWNLGVAPDDRWLCPLPLFHVGGLAILLRSAIYATTAVIHERFEPGAVREALESGEVTLVSLVATMLRRLRQAGLREAPALRAALIGGGPAPRELIEWAIATGLPVLQTYGMTETASQIVTASPRESAAHAGSAGRPLPGVDLQIAGDGEILVRGPMVARSALDGDGWLHTRDRGHLDGDGLLHVEGRIDDTVVTGGENVAVAEVEDALLSHPSVADAAVAGLPDPEWGEIVAAWVVLATHASDAELMAHCRARLAGFKVPKEFVRVRELPRNEAGKVLRARLRH
ncbi:MAG: o-succinylbenzoate--CoA ligase [Actinobacteria bacterium]|nr:MAG: o-succinylbenzoate--CoA ligase [Actinomycetota bacterium]TMM10995.1 MAG: o-succinylbenzoate--CoA ligase [Actinomycetota bacterium]